MGQDWSGWDSGLEHPDPKPGVDLSPEVLAAIKARAEAATSGPWEWRPDYVEPGRESTEGGLALAGKDDVEVVGAYNYHCCDFRIDVDVNEADQAFIAAARSDVPALVAEVEKLRAELAGFRRVGWIEPDYITGQRPEGRVVANREDWPATARVVEVFVRDSLTTAEREESAFRAFKREEYEFYAHQDRIAEDQARGGGEG